uniref:Uncharacterized protein n=1 Tax=Oryza glaberrima TaxID=4538 RepID=I1PJW2_ORYGL
MATWRCTVPMYFVYATYSNGNFAVMFFYELLQILSNWILTVKFLAAQLAVTQIPVVVILTAMNPFGAHMGCLPSMVCELPSNSQNMWPQVQFYQILTYSMATESLKHSRIFKFISI